MRYERDVDVFGIHAVLYTLGRDEFRAARPASRGSTAAGTSTA
jgi:hypothetical protein